MKIVFFGDSITEGRFEILETENGGINIVKEPASGYVAMLERRLKTAFPQKNIEVINAGISGSTSEDGLSRMDRDVLAHDPDCVVVCFALNDLCLRDLKGYSENMKQIFTKLNERGIKSVFLTPNTVNTYVHDETIERLIPTATDCAACQNDGTADALIETAIGLAEQYGVPVCDAYRVWKKLAEYGIDTTELLSNRINHPTRKMHGLFADLLFERLSAIVEETA